MDLNKEWVVDGDKDSDIGGWFPHRGVTPHNPRERVGVGESMGVIRCVVVDSRESTGVVV